MSIQRTVFEINNKTYYSPKGAAHKWGISHQAVTAACKEGRIVGAFQDSTKKWCIPDTAMKPLDSDIIRKILIITLSLKNTPNITISDLENYDIPKVYKYLKETGYIKDYNENSNRIPYEATLSDKGLSLAFDKKKEGGEWTNIATLFVQCIPSLIEIGAALVHT